MPGVCLQSPLRDLIPVESSASPSQDKGKGKAIERMDEGKSERGRLVSLTVSEFDVTISPFWPCFWPSSFLFSHQVHALLKVTLQENNKNIT
jgi:hypothetical protein